MSMNDDLNSRRVLLVSGSSKGIGRYLVEYYLAKGYLVVGCSRSDSSLQHENYRHFPVNVSHEIQVKEMFVQIYRESGKRSGAIKTSRPGSLCGFEGRYSQIYKTCSKGVSVVRHRGQRSWSN